MPKPNKEHQQWTLNRFMDWGASIGSVIKKHVYRLCGFPFIKFDRQHQRIHLPKLNSSNHIRTTMAAQIQQNMQIFLIEILSEVRVGLEVPILSAVSSIQQRLCKMILNRYQRG